MIVTVSPGEVFAAGSGDSSPKSNPSRVERLDDPYVCPDPRLKAGVAPAIVQSGPYVSVQVNVNAVGQNIFGDAANEPSLAISPVNPDLMVIGWRQFDNVASNFRQAGRGYSTDGGAHWTFPGVFTPGIFRSDPVLENLADGTFLYNSLQQNFFADMFISTDAINWSSPIAATGGDKLWMSVDRTNGPGRNNIYCAWSTAAGCCGSNIFTRSTDGGQTYMTPIGLPSSPIWGTLTVGPDGAVYVCGITGSTYRVVKSADAQFAAQTPTFAPAVTVNMGGVPNNNRGPNPGGLLGQTWIAADRSGGPFNGNIYMVTPCDPPGIDPLDITFSRSVDGGATWSSPVRINTDPANANAWQWFATMSVAPNGRIDVIWNDTRRSLQVNLSETFYGYSMDAGVTWSRNIRISPPWDSYIGWPNQNKIGDYYHAISDNAGCNLAYAATFNGEQDVWFVRVGDCNHNGVHDGVELANGELVDLNFNGIPDECESPPCFADVAPFGGDGTVNIDDLTAIITTWGPVAPGSPTDISPPGGNAIVNIDDLVQVLTHWGRCP